MGLCYCFGYIVDKDEAIGIEWYRKAAENGHVESMRYYAVMLRQGSGCKADSERSFKWFLKAAEAGNVDAQSSVAQCYHMARGTSRDDSAARYWYAKAIDGGSETAHEGLMVMGGGDVVDLAKRFNESLKGPLF
jgi:TPR repeat protein